MKPCYLDTHIHTSGNKNYKLGSLIQKVFDESKGIDCLISLTDHNNINLEAYKKLNEMALINSKIHYLVGAELSIRNYKNCPYYHCHFYFNVDIAHNLEDSINALNRILDELYPNKTPSDDDESVPEIQEIIGKLDDFEFLVLPHGGQSHRTFNKSIPEGARFDTVLQRNIYYNIFDGFTARTNKGLEETQEYFKRLGINEIINLITCTDNYDPSIYPQAKNASDDFIPTWMYSSPSFSGLRLALSESSRLSYGPKPRDEWQENIGKVFLENDRIKIDVNLEPGLNVVIGNSSSGKTLFVDSVYRKLDGNAPANEKYERFHPEMITVQNFSGIRPHFFSQNYILDILTKDKEDGTIDLGSLDIIKDNFKLDAGTLAKIDSNFRILQDDISQLIDSAEQISDIKTKIEKIPSFPRLLFQNENCTNPIDSFVPTDAQIEKLNFTKDLYDVDLAKIEEVEKMPDSLYFCDSFTDEIKSIKAKLLAAYYENQFEKMIRGEIVDAQGKVTDVLKKFSAHDSEVRERRNSLFSSIVKYVTELSTFFTALKSLSELSLSASSKEVMAAGHTLSMKNTLTIKEQDILDVFNDCLKNSILSFDEFLPSFLVASNFKARNPKIASYASLKEHVSQEFIKRNKVEYQIMYNGKIPFDELSPGLKSSVILDIILSNEDDCAPLIIDQPEDNLATNYINGRLISNFKKAKARRQIITVSHNATIPMLGDAQNIIICKNDNGKINITSHRMEDTFEGIPVTDWIATLTDGGKSSIKKRVKKYNIKDFKEDVSSGNQN